MQPPHHRAVDVDRREANMTGSDLLKGAIVGTAAGIVPWGIVGFLSGARGPDVLAAVYFWGTAALAGFLGGLFMGALAGTLSCSRPVRRLALVATVPLVELVVYGGVM